MYYIIKYRKGREVTVTRKWTYDSGWIKEGIMSGEIHDAFVDDDQTDSKSKDYPKHYTIGN